MKKKVKVMKKRLTKCVWIRHAPSWRPEGYVPAHDPDIVPDAASANALAKNLPENAHWQISPLKRCQQTAAQIEKAMIELGRPVAVQKTLTPEIIEQDLGDWAGAKLDDVWAELESAPRHNFSFQTADLIPPNGESFAQQYQRIADFMTDFSARISQAEDIRPHIFFAHAHTIRAVIAYCTGLPLDKALSIQIANYSQTIFHFLPHQYAHHTGGQWQVEAINLPATASR